MAISPELRKTFSLYPEAKSAYFFPKHFANGSPSPLKRHHIRLLRIRTDYKQKVVCVNLPAGHGKTIIIDHDLVIHEITENPNVMIKMLTPNLKKSGEGLVRDMLDTLHTNEKLIEAYGPFAPNPKQKHFKWGIDGFSVTKRTRKGRDDTLEVMGWAQAKPGWRANLIILDDIVDPENSATIEGRQKVINYFNEVIMKRMADPENFQIIVIGTKYEYGDLYHYLEDMAKKYPERYAYIKETAICEEDSCVDHNLGVCPFVDGNGNHVEHALWPEMYPLKELYSEREEDQVAFDKTRMNVVYPREKLIFSSIGIEMCKDINRNIGDIPDDSRCILTWDLAASGGRHAALSAIQVWAYKPLEPNKMYLVDLFSGKISLPDQIERCLALYELYKCCDWRIEANAMQKGIKQEVDKIIYQRGLIHIRTTPHYTGRNKLDPLIGIESLQPIVAGGNVSIPYATEHARIVVREFIRELARYPASEYIDNIMAFWFARIAVQEGLKEYRVRYLDSPSLMGINPIEINIR